MGNPYLGKPEVTGSHVWVYDDPIWNLIPTSSLKGTSGGTGDANAEYVVGSLTGSLPNALVLTAGPNITINTGSGIISITGSAAGSINSGSFETETIYPTASYHDLTHSPVALWQFSGSLTDNSGNGLTLSVSGNELYEEIAPGLLGFKFNGSSYLQRLVSDTELLITGALTIEAIVVVPESTGEVRFATMDDTGESLATNILYTFAGEGASQTYSYFAERAAGTNIVYSETTKVIPHHRPVHIAMTRDSDTNVIKFYQNGNLVANSSNLATSEYGSPTQTFKVGYWAALGTTSQEFAISSLKIINSSLSSGEIREEYEKTLGSLQRVTNVTNVGDNISSFSEIWSNALTSSLQDEEFDSTNITNWSIAHISGTSTVYSASWDRINLPDAYDTSFTSGSGEPRIAVHTEGRPSWALIQIPASTRYYTYKHVNLPENVLIWSRLRFSSNLSTAIDNDVGIGLFITSASMSSIPTRDNAVELYINEQDGNAIQAQFQEFFTGSFNPGGNLTNTINTAASNSTQVIEYAALHRVGNIVHAWVASSTSGWTYMGNYIRNDDFNVVGIVLECESLLAPGAAIFGVDFVRFKETDKFLL